MSDADQDTLAAVVFIALFCVLVGGLYWITELVRGYLHMRRDEARRQREIEDQKLQAEQAEFDLQNDLLDIGVKRGDLMTYRTVHTDYHGVEHIQFDLPTTEFIEQVQRAVQVHRRMVGAFGGRLELD